MLIRSCNHPILSDTSYRLSDLGVKILMKKSCRNVGFQFKFDFKKKFKSLCVLAFPYFLCTHITVEKFYQFKLSYGKSLWAKAIWLLTQFELPSVWGRYDCGVCNQKMLSYLLLNIPYFRIHCINHVSQKFCCMRLL